MEPVRRELQALRGDLPYVQVRPYEELIAPQKRAWRLGATMFSVFAGLSLLIAAVGLYGVLSYLVSERTRELGLRAALGATPGTLLEMIVRSGLASALLGVVLGLSIVVLVAGKLGSLLYPDLAARPRGVGGRRPGSRCRCAGGEHCPRAQGDEGRSHGSIARGIRTQRLTVSQSQSKSRTVVAPLRLRL